MLAAVLVVPILAVSATQPQAAAVHQVHAGQPGHAPACCDEQTGAARCLWACLASCSIAVPPTGSPLVLTSAIDVPDVGLFSPLRSEGPPTDTPPPKRPA